MNAHIDITNIELNTERLKLRPWKMDDLEDLYEYASVDGVGQMAGWYPHRDIIDSFQVINMYMAEKRNFAIEYKEKVIGALGIEEYEEDQLPDFRDKLGRELSFTLSKNYWGQGIMPEAVNAVLEYLKNEVKVDFVVCTNFIENNQSMRVQEKCGFKPLKRILQETRYGEKKDSWLSLIIFNGNH